VRVFIVGAGQVGSTIVEALHTEHELVVLDLDEARLAALANRYDVVTFPGNGASRRVLKDAGVEKAELFIACTSRDEANIIAALLAKNLAPKAQTIVRTTNEEYLEVWHERHLDVDFMVSSELEAARAVVQIGGMPAARHTDIFAEGQVQMVEFEVPANSKSSAIVGKTLAEADTPYDSRVASIIRGDNTILPRGGETILPGDRIVVIGSPKAVREWSSVLAGGEQRVGDVVVYGGGRTGIAIARMLLEQGSRVRIIEAHAGRAREIAAMLPGARVFCETGMDPDFLERERIGQAELGIFAMRDDAKNHYAATLAKLYGLKFTIAMVHDRVSVEVFEAAGVDVAVNARLITAEEIVRFAHDPRTRQVSMLEQDRFEILDVTVRPESELIGKPFSELPMTGALIGAIVRDEKAIFPHGQDMLLPGDRVIVFTESARAAEVERTL
jgi:trk system potassium uptake protein TrkA